MLDSVSSYHASMSNCKKGAPFGQMLPVPGTQVGEWLHFSPTCPPQPYGMAGPLLHNTGARAMSPRMAERMQVTSTLPSTGDVWT